MAEAFAKRYTGAVRNLLGSVPDAAGMDEQSLSRAERHFDVVLPGALRDYYLILGNLHQLNDAHDRLFAPKDWFINCGKLVFMVENQAVVYWGIEATQSPGVDVPVFQGVNLLPKCIEWHPECDSCGEFLLVMLHWQAVAGGLKWLGMANRDGQQAEKTCRMLTNHFATHWQQVGGFIGLVAFGQDGKAACLLTGDGVCQLYVGARTEPMFEEVDEELQALGVSLSQL
jgi:hypothetical protein